MSSKPYRYHRAQFPPSLTWMNREQQVFPCPILYLKKYMCNVFSFILTHVIDFDTFKIIVYKDLPSKRKIFIAISIKIIFYYIIK